MHGLREVGERVAAGSPVVLGMLRGPILMVGMGGVILELGSKVPISGDFVMKEFGEEALAHFKVGVIDETLEVERELRILQVRGVNLTLVREEGPDFDGESCFLQVLDPCVVHRELLGICQCSGNLIPYIGMQ